MRLPSPSHLVLLAVISYSHQAAAENYTAAGSLPAANQTWGFGPSDRCRLLAHKSVIVQNGDHNLLIIDGGFGFFQTKVNGITSEVADLNPFTAAFDLSKDFSTPGLNPLWAYRKPLNSSQRFSMTNFGGLWSSQDGNTIWYQGGHYYNVDGYNTSYYHVDKPEIPAWQLWQMDLTKREQGWSDVTNNTSGHEVANRTFAGGAVSVPEMGTSYWLGGLEDRTTAKDTPEDTLQTTSQMLIYNESTKTITRQKYYSTDSTDGYYQGGLVHLPIGSKHGYLMSLFSLKKATDTPWVDPDGESGNTEVADPVTLDSIRLYDLETGQWFEQDTAWFLDQVPEPRTRFCSALFHDKTDNTWNLWVHGGQLLSDQNQGVREIYVLSMPSFIWSKVETTLPDTNLIRSHSCHAVGSQFVIVGGTPPAQFEPANSTCDPEYIKVLNIGETSISWTGSYTPNTEYKTPQIIRNVVGARTAPIAGFANTKLQTDFEFRRKSSSKKIGAIAGGVVGGVIILAVLSFCLWKRFQRQKPNPLTNRYNSTTPGDQRPASLVRDYPEVIKIGEPTTGDYRQATQSINPVYPMPMPPQHYQPQPQLRYHEIQGSPVFRNDQSPTQHAM